MGFDVFWLLDLLEPAVCVITFLEHFCIGLKNDGFFVLSMKEAGKVDGIFT